MSWSPADFIPADFKETVLLPLLKKVALDPDIFNNFRPISNLMFISKLIERVTASRLYSHMITNDLCGEYPTGNYIATKTALASVHDDMLKATDDNRYIFLIILVQRPAFDTVVHEILLRRLSCMLDIFGSVLQWLCSYLTDRKHKVVVNDVFAKSTPLISRVSCQKGPICHA